MKAKLHKIVIMVVWVLVGEAVVQLVVVTVPMVVKVIVKGTVLEVVVGGVMVLVRVLVDRALYINVI